MNDDELTKYWARKYGPMCGLASVIRGVIERVRADCLALERQRILLAKGHALEALVLWVERQINLPDAFNVRPFGNLDDVRMFGKRVIRRARKIMDEYRKEVEND